MKKNYNKIIAKIALARKKNNINWMNLLKISIKYAGIKRISLMK